MVLCLYQQTLITEQRDELLMRYYQQGKQGLEKSLEIVDNQVRCVLYLHVHTRRGPCGKILDVLLSK